MTSECKTISDNGTAQQMLFTIMSIGAYTFMI